MILCNLPIDLILVLKLQNYVIMYFDQGKCVFLVLLDLSTAFDTIDHTMLINLLEPQYHISGTTLKWMRSYLSGWSSRINISGEFSEPWTAQFGVPQAKFFFPRQFRTPSTNSFAYSQSELHDMNMNDLRLRNKSTHARGLVILL